MPGTKMAFAGLPSRSDIDDIKAHLKSFGPEGKKGP